jgi:hypothetical protein
MFSGRSTTSSSSSVTRRRRSKSVATDSTERIRDDRRIPAIQMKDEKDVGTLVCTEISRAMLIKPGADLKVFLKSASDSRRDINISDSTVLISVAILDHIGNREMAKVLLSKSDTLTRYYERMGLKDAGIRSLFVTMLFALCPDFTAALEQSMIICLQRSSANGKDPLVEGASRAAMSVLALEGNISTKELTRTLSFDEGNEISLAPLARRIPVTRAPMDLVSPWDSISNTSRSAENSPGFNDSDLMKYSMRRRLGKEPDFCDVFKSAKQPVKVTNRRVSDKSGIGFNNNFISDQDPISQINSLLGSMKVKSVDPRSGTISYRSPRVSDFLDSEEVSTSAYYVAPDVKSQFELDVDYRNNNFPLPTDFTLPTTAYVTDNTKQQSKEPEEDLDAIMAKLGL